MLCTDVGDQAMSAAAGRTAIASFPRCACRRALAERRRLPSIYALSAFMAIAKVVDTAMALLRKNVVELR
jgi:hypothetical protein